MTIKIFKDVKSYALVSSLTKEDLETVKKYRPAALKKKDAEGNDVFGISYNEGYGSIGTAGVTFGSVSTDGKAMITGKFAADVKPENYGATVADLVGGALEQINDFEATIPDVVKSIKDARTALIDGIVEV